MVKENPNAYLKPPSEWTEGKTLWDPEGDRQRMPMCSLTYAGRDDEKTHKALARKKRGDKDVSTTLRYEDEPDLLSQLVRWLAEAERELEPPTQTKTNQFNMRMTPRGRRLLERLSAHLGISMSDVVEMAIRKNAEKEGIS